jgi:6-phosphogluconolactonase
VTNQAIAYVANADSREIGILRLDRARGSLELIGKAAAGGAVMPLAPSPDKRFLYASLRSEPFSVASFAIDPHTGALSRIGTAPLPDSMANIVVDRTGQWLFAASYGGDKISLSRIGEDGVAGPAVSELPTGKHAHAAIIDATNRHLYVTNLGSDQVLQFRFDAASGKLTPKDRPPFKSRPGSGPRHFIIAPSGRHAYLLNELDATVDLLAVDADQGTLTLVNTWPTLPPGADVKPWAADIHITPDGRFVYTSERNTSTLAMWKVDAATGELTLMGHVPTETQPRGFQVDSTGEWLLAVGQVSNSLTAYRIDAATGKLTPKVQVPMGRDPNWVEIVDLP